MRMKRYFVQRNISSAFESLGASIGRHPLPYFLIPFIITAMLSFKFFSIHLTKDVEYLYSPINGRSLREREAVESIFPLTYGFDMLTVTSLKLFGTILVVPKHDGTILREDLINEIVRIDDAIQHITVFHGNKNYTYADLCFTGQSGECSPNEVLGLREKIGNGKKLRIKYPIQIDEDIGNVTIYATGLGGVITDTDGYVLDAKAMRLFYFLNYTTTDEKKIAGIKWEEAFEQVVLEIRSESLNLGLATSQSINNEMSKLTEIAAPYIFITGLAMVTFAVFSCLTTNWITSKPWVAVGGCISPVLAVGTSFGLLLLCGVQYIDINIMAMFLLLGIGLDDSFVILAAWRRTDPKEKVEVRMSQAYKEAAISITITSVTNFLSLCFGLTTSYRVVRIYCIYAATSVFIDYIYQITFFGGVLALSGYREKRNLHSFLCIPVRNQSIPKSRFLKLLYVGWDSEDEIFDEERQDSKRNYTEAFLTAITTSRGKCVVIAAFIMYLSTSIYGLQFVKEGFDYRDSMPFNSYLIDYFTIHYKHFTLYPQPIQVVINETLDYSDVRVQKDIEETILSFYDSPIMENEHIGLSWLKLFLESTREGSFQFSYSGYNISDPNDFISALKNVFLKFEYAKFFKKHIRFNQNETEIIASRFIVTSKDVQTSEQEKALLLATWRKADSCKYRTYVHNIFFPLYNMLLGTTSSSVETMCTAAIIITAVFFIFVPNVMCTIGILFTIVSIEIGVIGCMSLWNVSLDPVSMMCIIISIGLSVDYAAHISYGYLSCENRDPNEKTKKALRVAGYPIIQGCISTFLGVAVIGTGPSNVFFTFFKVLTLVMLIAAFHGIFVIPIMLNAIDVTCGILYKRCRKTPATHFLSSDTKFHGVGNHS